MEQHLARIYAATGRKSHGRTVQELEQRADPPAPGPEASAKERMKHRLETKEGRELYALRKQTIEPIFGIAQGCGDLNNHDTLRHYLIWQSAIEQDRALASSPTLCRLEQRANRQTAVGMDQLPVEQFIAYFKEAPQS